MREIILVIKKHWQLLLFLFLMASIVFLRFYGLENYSQFNWDQVDNAWAAKNILVDHRLPLAGMVAKENSGIYIGPLYYYVIAVFYFFTNLDPIASIIIAALTSVFSAFILFFVTKKLFSIKVALLALFIQTVAVYQITLFDRVQWPVDFIPSLSLLILYFLYRVITHHEKSLIWLGIVIGCMFNIHFTAIYFPILIILSLPFFPRTKKALIYGLVGLGIAFVFLIPSILIFLQNKSYGSTIYHYGNSSYHGFHLRRIIQLTGDALIQFVPYLYFSVLSWLRFILFPIFVILYIVVSRTKKVLPLAYLFSIWFFVPWIVLSAYAGEISDYYFASTRFLALISIAFIVSYIFFTKRNKAVAIIGSIVLLLYGYMNLSYFFTHPADRPMAMHREKVLREVHIKQVVPFTVGDPDSYFYYIYTRR